MVRFSSWLKKNLKKKILARDRTTANTRSIGQVQGYTTPCAAITTAPTPNAPNVPVSQYPDGQIQVTPGAPAVSVSAPRTQPLASTGPDDTMLRTTATSPPTVVPTLAPPIADAGRFELPYIAAVVVGIMGAIWMF